MFQNSIEFICCGVDIVTPHQDERMGFVQIA